MECDATSCSPRLGAIELVELGRRSRQEIFPPGMGQVGDIAAGVIGAGAGGPIGGVSGFFSNVLSAGLGTLADVVKAPFSALSQGLGTVFTELAGILRNIPILGDIVAALLLVVNAAIQLVLSIPGFIMDQMKNLFGGLSKSFGQAFAPTLQRQKLDSARGDLVNRAPEPIRQDVKTTLEGRPVEVGAGLPAGETVGTGTLVAIGVAAAATAAFIL